MRPCFTSTPIRQALADNAADARFKASEIADFAGVPFEILLRRVAVQMGFGNVMEGPENGALQEAEITFDRVGVPEIGAGIFVGRMVHSAMQ